MKLTKTRIIKRAWGILLYLFTFLPLSAQYQTYPQQMERLDRGVVALPAQEQGNFVSWRLLGTDAKGTTFDLLRDGKTIAKGLSVTNYVDKEGSSTSRYSVVTHPTSAISPLTLTMSPRGQVSIVPSHSTDLKGEPHLTDAPTNTGPTTVRLAMWMATDSMSCSSSGIHRMHTTTRMMAILVTSSSTATKSISHFLILSILQFPNASGVST